MGGRRAAGGAATVAARHTWFLAVHALLFALTSCLVCFFARVRVALDIGDIGRRPYGGYDHCHARKRQQRTAKLMVYHHDAPRPGDAGVVKQECAINNLAISTVY